MIGVRNFFRMAADVSVAASTVLITTTLTSPIAAGQTQRLRVWMPFTVGATGGIKLQLILPAAPAYVAASYVVFDTVTPAVLSAFNLNNNAYANALAVAGTHIMCADFYVINGTTAGSCDLQVACNSAANGITALKGSTMEVIKF